MKLCFTIGLWVLVLGSYCQNIGARNIALGNTFSTQNDVISSSANISKLASIHSLSIGISSFNAYMTKELQESLLCVVTPLFNGTLSLSVSNFGFRYYRENSLSVAYAMKLGPKFNLGVQLVSNFLFLSERKSVISSVYPNLGLNYKISDKIQFALLLRNLTMTKISSEASATWPIDALIGSKYKINKKLSIYLDYLTSLKSKNRISFGTEYYLHEKIIFRIGANSYPSTFSFGLGLDLKNFQIDLGSSYHSLIGFSPSLSLRFESSN